VLLAVLITDIADISMKQGLEMVKDELLGTYAFGHHIIFIS
jgi:hypothetical protein